MRRKEYACDITYGTNNEFGFDYLRDNMTWSPEGKVQRGHNYCHRRRDRLHPHRRGADAADHLRPGRGRHLQGQRGQPARAQLDGSEKGPRHRRIPERGRRRAPRGRLQDRREGQTHHLHVQGMNKIEELLLKRGLIRVRSSTRATSSSSTTLPRRPPTTLRKGRGLRRPGGHGPDRRRVHRAHTPR